MLVFWNKLVLLYYSHRKESTYVIPVGCEWDFSKTMLINQYWLPLHGRICFIDNVNQYWWLLLHICAILQNTIYLYTSASHEESNANQKSNKIFIQYCTFHTASFSLFLTLSDSLFLSLALLYLLCTYVERVLLYNMIILIIFKYMDTYIIIIHPPNISARTSVHLYTYKYTPPLALLAL